MTSCALQVIKVYEVGTWFTPCIFDDEPCHMSLVQAKQNGTVDLSRLAGYHRYQGTWKPCMGECFKDKDHRTKGDQNPLQGNVDESLVTTPSLEQAQSDSGAAAPSDEALEKGDDHLSESDVRNSDSSSSSDGDDGDSSSSESDGHDDSSSSESDGHDDGGSSSGGEGESDVRANGSSSVGSTGGSKQPAWRSGKKLQVDADSASEPEQALPHASSSLLNHIRYLKLRRRKAGS